MKHGTWRNTSYGNDLKDILAQPRPPSGCTVVTPAADELFIDIDSLDDLGRFLERFEETFKGMFPTATYKISPSRGKGKFHVVVKAEGLVFTDIQRVAAQAALGSDWRRELFAVVKHVKINETHTCFFERSSPCPSTSVG